MSNEKDLTIIDLPAMNLQAKCHEGENGTTHFKKYVPDLNKKHIPMLNSYQFAMGQVYAESLGLNVIKK